MQLFGNAGFVCKEYKVHERQIENKRRELTMHRRWVQAIFLYSFNSSSHLADDVTASSGTLSTTSNSKLSASCSTNSKHLTSGPPQDPPDVQLANEEQQQPVEPLSMGSEQHSGPSSVEINGARSGSVERQQEWEEGNGQQEVEQGQGQHQWEDSQGQQGMEKAQGQHRWEDSKGQQQLTVGKRQQEWEAGGTAPEEELLTGCLFAENGVEEVLCFS